VGVEALEEVGVLGEVERRDAAMVRRMWDSVDRVARVTHASSHSQLGYMVTRKETHQDNPVCDTSPLPP
jgi:hypothetical protein